MPEYLVRHNDMLCWSGLLGSFRIDEDGRERVDEDVPDDYLFRPQVFSQEFWDIACEMTQLNDFCALCLQQTDIWCRKLREELQDLENGTKDCVTPWGDYTGEMVMQLEEEIAVWEDTNRFISRAMCLIMLSAFVERSLKSLCVALAPQVQTSPRPHPGESKITGYLRFLKEECEVDFDEPQESVDVREQCRQIRNHFAHGDWDAVKQRVGTAHLRDAFRSAANLLNSIEAGAWQSPWAEAEKS